MVYAKYIKRNGKRFGPYYYKSVRDKDGTVRNIYVGRTPPKAEKLRKPPADFSPSRKSPHSVISNARTFHEQYKRSYVPVTLLVMVALAAFIMQPVPTGLISADLQTVSYSPGEVLNGFVSMEFGPQDLLPTDALVEVSVGNRTSRMPLDEFLSSSGSSVPSGSGTYYKSGRPLGGSGEGFGLPGVKSRPITLDFSYNLTVMHPTAITIPYNTTREITEEVFNETLNRTVNVTTTQTVTLHNTTVETASYSELVEGTVSAGSPHVHETCFNITDYSVSVLSVSTGNRTLPNDTISVDFDGDSFVTTTGYSETEEGFGEGYLSNRTEEVRVGMRTFNLTAPEEPGTYELSIRLVYNGSTISETNMSIIVDQPFADRDGDGYTIGEDCDDSNASISPGANETCDGIDNNCDGRIDEGCEPEPECAENQTMPCGNSTGICTEGMMICINGTWSGCLNATLPAPEACDGLDNDCDGVVDDGCNITNITETNITVEEKVIQYGA
ncbi:MAG: hypothetical protein DRO99_00935, partial [Candidatus Aenigmatarchaeota archaeon]